MRIAAIKISNICQNVPPLFTGINTTSERTLPPVLSGINGDIFTHSKKVTRMPKDFGGPKFTIKDYEKVKSTQIPDILKNNPEALQMASENVPMGIALKKILDEKYGENNYIFVSLGRSPASIGRVLEFSGVEVKYIPASGLNQSCCYSRSTMASYFDFVLSKQGLTKEKAEENFKNSGKKVVVYDYTHSGESLKKAEKVMRCMGYKPKFTDFRSLNADLENGPAELNANKAVEHYVDTMRQERGYKYKRYSGIPYARMVSYDPAYNKCYDRLKDLRYLIINYVPGEKPAYYNMAVMHLLQKQGLLNENNANKAAF